MRGVNLRSWWQGAFTGIGPTRFGDSPEKINPKFMKYFTLPLTIIGAIGIGFFIAVGFDKSHIIHKNITPTTQQMLEAYRQKLEVCMPYMVTWGDRQKTSGETITGTAWALEYCQDAEKEYLEVFAAIYPNVSLNKEYGVTFFNEVEVCRVTDQDFTKQCTTAKFKPFNR